MSQMSLKKVMTCLLPVIPAPPAVGKRILPRSFAQAKQVPEKYKHGLVEAVPKDTYTYLKSQSQHPGVGKGSNYGLKLAAEFLGTEYDSETLKRKAGTLSRQRKIKILELSKIEQRAHQKQDIQQEKVIDDLNSLIKHDTEDYKKRLFETVDYYKSLQSSSDGQILLSNVFREKVHSMLSILKSITNPHRLEYRSSCVKVYPAESTSEIPPLAVNAMNQEQFDNYIGLLTHTIFTFKSSSKSNGIIPNILRLLMNKDNFTTKNMRSTSAYNDTIFFFRNKGDLASCLEYFEQMVADGVKRNTKTYNIIIGLIAEIQNRRLYTRPALDRILPLLKNMKTNNVCADLTTWTYAYSSLFDIHSKQLFLQRMKEYSVPASGKLIYYLIKENYDQNSALEILDFLIESKAPLNNRNLYLVLKKLLDENDYKGFFLVLNFVKHSLFQTVKLKTLDSNIMNIYLAKTSEIGRLDLTVMGLHTLIRDFQISSNSDTLKLLYKAVSRRGMHKLYHYSFDYVNRLAYDLNGKNVPHSYWRTKALSILKVDCTNEKKKNLGTIMGDDMKREMDKQMRLPALGMVFQTDIWHAKYERNVKFLRILGSMPGTKLKDRSINSSTMISDKTPSQSLNSKRRAKYMSRIKYIGLQKELGKRVKYIKNGVYTGLKSEILERNLLVINDD